MKKKIKGFAIVIALIMTVVVLTPNAVKAVSDPTIAIDNVEGKAGEDVTVNITMINNPGLVTMKLLVEWDANVVTLKSVKNGDVISGEGVTFVKSQYLTDNPQTLSWVSVSTEDHTANGTLVTLVFTIEENVQPGTTSAITATYDADDVLNVNLDPVAYTIENGSIMIPKSSNPDPTPIIPETGNEHDVLAKYNAEAVEDVYKVDVTWGGMEFDFVAGEESWNTETHQWSKVTADAWNVKEGSSNEIKVENHSSTAVNVNLSFEGTVTGVDGSFSEATFSLAMPTEGANGTTKTVEFMPTGTLESNVINYVKIGTITLEIG